MFFAIEIIACLDNLSGWLILAYRISRTRSQRPQMNPNDLDLRLLRSFLVVAHSGKISSAAKQLHLSQPAVTAHLRRLEEIVGKPLISRSTRGVKLTSYGHTLRSLATEVQNTLTRIEASFHQYPDVTVELRVDNTSVVLEAVRESNYPFGLVEGNPRAAGLRLEKFVDDELVLVAGTNSSYRQYQQLAATIATPQDLYRIPLIWREAGSGTRAVVETALRKSGVQLKRLTYQYVMADVQAIKTATVHGLGFAFLSRWSAKNELATGQLRILQIANLAVRRGFYWVLPSGALGEPSDSFVRFCQQNRSQLTPAASVSN